MRSSATRESAVSLATLLVLTVQAVGCSKGNSASGELASDLRTAGEVSSLALPGPAGAALGDTSRTTLVQPLQAVAGSEHDIRLAGDVAVAVNRRRGLRAELDGGRVTLLSARGDSSWRAELELVALERGAAGTAVPSSRTESVSEAEPEILDNRVEFRRPGLTEWWENGPLGLEQGFTLENRPVADADGELRLRFGLAGNLVPACLGAGSPAAQGTDPASCSEVALNDRSGAAVVRAHGLTASDATGKDVPVRFEVTHGQLALTLDDSHAEYPVEIDPIWTQETKLLPGTEFTHSGMRVGRRVSISGDRAVVGGYLNTELYSPSIAYAFDRSNSAWGPPEILTYDRSGDGIQIGASVSVDGDLTAVGEPGWANMGRVELFWYQGGHSSLTSATVDSLFGTSVSVDAGRIAVGSPGYSNYMGQVLTYHNGGSGWVSATLLASDRTTGDRFGSEVSVSGETIAAGAPYNGDHGSRSGAGYIFVRTGISTWQQQQIVPDDGAEHDYFGSKVSLSGDTVVFGVAGDDDLGAESGSAYVYVRDGSSWSLLQKLTASDGDASDNFGASVSIDEDLLAVGATGYDGAHYDCGAVYLFRRTGTEWREETILLAGDGAESDAFGSSVSVDGRQVLVGAPGDDDVMSDLGSAYVFSFLGENGEPCTTDEDCASRQCADGVCCDAACGGEDPDDCQACAVAAGAETDGVCALLPASHTCRTSAGVCDAAEACTGSNPSCPADTFQPATTECRASAGVCDQAETCTGSSASCPSNSFRPPSTECRAAAGVCDQAETCTGSGASWRFAIHLETPGAWRRG